MFGELAIDGCYKVLVSALSRTAVQQYFDTAATCFTNPRY